MTDLLSELYISWKILALNPTILAIFIIYKLRMTNYKKCLQTHEI